MKMFFNYEGSFKEVYFDKVISFHGCIDNQNKLYDAIVEGLSGSDKTFLLNNACIKKKELNLIEFSSNSILDDLKLTSKSYNLKILEDIIAKFEDNELLYDINKLLHQYEEKIINEYGGWNQGADIIKPSVKVESIKKLITNNFELVSKDSLNISNEVDLQLNVILKYVSMHIDEEYFLILKHFDHCLDIDQMKELVDRFKSINNLKVIIFTKSFELFEYFTYNNLKTLMIGDRNIQQLSTDEIFSEAFTYMTDSEYENYIRVANLMERYKNYRKSVTEKRKKYENPRL